MALRERGALLSFNVSPQQKEPLRLAVHQLKSSLMPEANGSLSLSLSLALISRLPGSIERFYDTDFRVERLPRANMKRNARRGGKI
jgi:hypothetical protein